MHLRTQKIFIDLKDGKHHDMRLNENKSALATLQVNEYKKQSLNNLINAEKWRDDFKQ